MPGRSAPSGLDRVAETYVTPRTLDRELEGWMREIRPFQWRRRPPLRGRSSALIVVDMTRPFVEKGYPLSSPNARAIVPRMTRAIAAFRRAGRPVLWLAQGHHSVASDRGPLLHAWWPRPLLEGTPDVRMARGLSPRRDEKVIVKRRYSGFLETDLDLTLRCLGITDVVVCGVLTHMCPYLTAFDAFMRGYRVYYPADLTASVNRALHVHALRSVAGWCGHVVSAAWVSRSL